MLVKLIQNSSKKLNCEIKKIIIKIKNQIIIVNIFKKFKKDPQENKLEFSRWRRSRRT